MKPFLAAAIQMNSQPDIKHNMDQAREAVARAAREGARFVALPENFAFLGSETEKHRQAEPISEAVLSELPKWAKQFGIWLLAGGFPVRSEPQRKSSRVFNRAAMIDPSGAIIAQYDKIHLFDVRLSDEEQYRESDMVQPGQPGPVVCNMSLPDETSGRSGTGGKDEAGMADVAGATDATSAAGGADATDATITAGRTGETDATSVTIGLSICYDLRFPELYRRLSDSGAGVLCVPSAFTRPTGKAHWEVLLRARAVENSCYVIAPAQTGLHGKSRQTYGHSLIVDPWGAVLSDAGTEPGMAVAEIDPEHIRDVRQKLPSLRHRVL